MIFISHTHKDKPVVEEFAIRLANVFGQDEVFYDSWSIQPGEGIIDRMNDGIEESTLFLFFVSKNSLQSKMVDLEWQNALLKATRGSAKLVPVKLDDCMMPPILLQTLYVDLFGQGLEVALRQVVDIVQGRNTYRPGPQQFSNLRATITEEDDRHVVEVVAEHFLEPISHFLIVVENEKNDLSFKCLSHNMCTSGFHQDIKLTDGRERNAQFMGVTQGTTPGFPFIVEIRRRSEASIKVVAILHEKARNRWEAVPLIRKRGLFPRSG